MNNPDVKGPRLIRRALQAALADERDRHIISTVLGPRQVGKTTLFSQVAADLRASGVPERNIVFLNLDDLELRDRLVVNPSGLGAEIETMLGRPLRSLDAPAYLFLDEAQKAPRVLESVKMLFETAGRRLKIYLSGSSSLELRRQSGETLAGRIRYHCLPPVTLKEFLAYHGVWPGGMSVLDQLVSGRLTEAGVREVQAAVWKERRSIDVLRGRMLLFGALPAVCTEPEVEQRWYILRDYTATYIEKDIRAMEGVRNIDLYHRLYRSLLLQHGRVLNVSNLAADLGMSRNTVISYLNILEQTFVLHRVPSYARRPKARLLKAPKGYFFDGGLVNHGTRQTSLEALKTTGRLGFVEEGLVLNQMLAVVREMSVPAEVCYLRDYRGHEVDFVVGGPAVTAVEVTTETSVRGKRYGNLLALTAGFPVRTAVVIGRFEKAAWETAGGTRILLLPSWLAW